MERVKWKRKKRGEKERSGGGEMEKEREGA